jgi:hypothetical protein
MSRQTRVNSKFSDLSQTQLISRLIMNQNQQLFEIHRRKTELEKLKIVNRVQLTKNKTQLKMNLMKQKSKARIKTTSTLTTAENPVAFKNNLIEKNDILDEIFFEIKALNARYVDLSQEKIVKIFLNKFRSINLYRLRHMRDLQYDVFNDLNRIDIENDLLKLKKTSNTYKNFEKNFYEMWSEIFLNYIFIMISLFDTTISDLHSALIFFHNNIHQLSRVYEWQDALFLMTIEMHIYIITCQSTNSSQWIIRSKFQKHFCNSLILIDNKRKRFTSLISREKTSRGKNNASTTCDNYNKKVCTWSQCERAHKCKECEVSTHELSSCSRKT